MTYSIGGGKMAAPATPRLISGKVYSPRGIPEGATVTATFGTSTTSVTVNSSGEYVLDVSAAGAGVGDTVSIKAVKGSWGSKTESVVVTEAPQQQDITLTLFEDNTLEVSPYPPDYSDRVPMRWSIIGDSNGNNFSSENPFPTQSVNRPLTMKMENNASGQPTYIGEAAPGTPTNEARWRIRKMEYDDGTSSPPTGEVWANGNAEFDKTWNSRTTYNYS